MRTAKRLMEELPLKMNDIARLVLEATEGLGEARWRGLGREEMMRLLRRVVQEGVRAVEESEATVSFAEAVQRSVEARAGRRPTTRRDLRHFTGRMLRVAGVGERPLRAMRSGECRELLQAAFGRSAHSYRKGRAILHSIFAWGRRYGYCDTNPVDAVEAPEVVEKEIVPLTPEEVHRLETAAEHPAHRAMRWSLYLLLYCGLRPAEVQRLQPEDICREEGCVVVRPRVSKTGGGRAVPLRRVQPLSGVEPHIPRNWQNRWRSLRRAAGFAPRRWVPDVCRHTFASYHAAQFKNLPMLQVEMGHRDCSLLRSRYVNVVRGGGKLW
ncbi:MAG: site-specific integrase [Akkermansia sp.]|nr:site-specific integrase [Akkermansia sp.]